MFKKNTTVKGTKTQPSIADLLLALEGLRDPIDDSDLLLAKRFSGLTIKNDVAQICLTIDPAKLSAYAPLEEAIKERVNAIAGISNTLVVLTAHQPIDAASPEHQALSRGQLHLPNIKRIVAVGSGKGGVGKSTVSVNLAVTLHKLGLKVGLLDADIYGPSLPMMLGLSGQPDVDANGKMIPLEAQGIKTMSMGYLIRDDTPVIWRGPMIQSALQKFLSSVAWGDLDILIIDLPPGTGDVQLTLIQKVSLTGAIIVSTPQDVALLDAKKALLMFQKVDIPILGMIENMSFFECPSCKTHTAIFNQHGVEETAKKQQVDFLGAIPLALEIRNSSDIGIPFASKEEVKRGYFSLIAENLLQKLKLSNPLR